MFLLAVMAMNLSVTLEMMISVCSDVLFPLTLSPYCLRMIEHLTDGIGSTSAYDSMGLLT